MMIPDIAIHVEGKWGCNLLRKMFMESKTFSCLALNGDKRNLPWPLFETLTIRNYISWVYQIKIKITLSVCAVLVKAMVWKRGNWFLQPFVVLLQYARRLFLIALTYAHTCGFSTRAYTPANETQTHVHTRTLHHAHAKHTNFGR